MADIPRMADNVDLAKMALDQALPDPVAYGLPYTRDCSLEKGIPKFLARTYELVSDPATDYCISWTQEGTSFIIHDRDALIKDVLAQFFSHANLASFIRQINMYSMRKVGPASTQEFFHPAFIRGHPRLLKYIKRRRGVNAAAAAAAAVASGFPMAADGSAASGAGGAVAGPVIAKQIAVLKSERVELEEDISLLRETQASMEDQLNRVVSANVLLREELRAALAQQQRMQETVTEIMRLLPAAATSGVFGAGFVCPPVPSMPAPAPAPVVVGAKRARGVSDLDGPAESGERQVKRPRVDTSRQGLQAAPAATVSTAPVQTPEPTSARFLDAFFRELNGVSSATPMLVSALDEGHTYPGFPLTASGFAPFPPTASGSVAFPPSAAAGDFGAPSLSPLFRREKTPFSAALFKSPAAGSVPAAPAPSA